MKDNLDKIYLETIYPIKDNILTIYAQNKNKQYTYEFNLNKFSDIPTKYKNVAIFYSAKNKDPNHVLNQLTKRLLKKYTHKDILIIVKRTIDYYFQHIDEYKFNQSFLIESKSYPDFVLPIQITENNINLFDREELIKKYTNLFNCKYFCFIYTVLAADMISVNKNDKSIIVESQEYQKVIIK